MQASYFSSFWKCFSVICIALCTFAVEAEPLETVAADNDFAYRELEIDSYWQVGGNRYHETCSGVIFDTNYVLTARHCVDREHTIWVAHERSSGYVNGKIWTPAGSVGGKFDPKEFRLIEVSMPVRSSVKAFRSQEEVLNFVRLAQKQNENILFYGATSNRMLSGKILRVDSNLNKILISSIAKPGDSGGPVWIGDTLIGVVSAAGHSGTWITLFYSDLFGNLLN